MSGYVCWTKHGELGVLEGENEEEEDGNIDFAQYNSFADTLIGDVDDEDITDGLAQMLHDAKEDCDNERDWKKLERIDKGFNELLMLIKKFLPEGNKLPATTYEAKDVVCPLGLEVQKIHACPNDYILYRRDYKDLECFPVCKASRYKIKRDDPRDVEGEPPRKRVPAKVMNKKHAKMIRWHKEERKQDGMLRHPANGSQWRKIDRTYPESVEDARNIRLGLSTDGMNHFSEMSSSHSTWPMTPCMYNLSPWLCVKWKFIMMPALIQGPKQPGNDIDVYLQPLVEELLLLWTEGVRMWDAHKEEAFDLWAMLFLTINDWPALANLSGQSNKGFRACVHCLDETESTHLKHCRKVVYVGGHHRFLGGKHPVRKKGKHFNGKEENRGKPIHRSGKLVFEMVKSLSVVFGKGPDSFLGTYGKNKDTLEAREDMATLKGKPYLGTAGYALSKREKESMFECLDSIKVPSRYSSNVQRIIKCKDKKFVHLKSHDCHALMTQLVPVVLRGIVPETVRKTFTKLCAFLNAISQKSTLHNLGSLNLGGSIHGGAQKDPT
ncbi:hypothetical protein U9M48_039024 [Paspalum notatum var. saurae]|uniref:Transposase n=1 Tax=Paspalum notatum var. saurae TaxID=547442 RepID=A0AAQ3UJ77_PASNO